MQIAYTFNKINYVKLYISSMVEVYKVCINYNIVLDIQKLGYDKNLIVLKVEGM